MCDKKIKVSLFLRKKLILLKLKKKKKKADTKNKMHEELL